MYSRRYIEELITCIKYYDGRVTKDELSKVIQNKFNLTLDRKVYVGKYFAIRFSSAKKKNPSNTVLSLAKLKKYDCNPFFVCIVTPEKNYILLANSTFIKKISHSSQTLSIDNIKGSFNAPDIERTFEGLENIPDNFEELYCIHENYSFQDNLRRIVNTTNSIIPSGKKFIPNEEQRKNILDAPYRTLEFMKSNAYQVLKKDLDDRTASVKLEIQAVEEKYSNNVNMRGRLVEYFIVSDDLQHKKEIYEKIKNNEVIDDLMTEDGLGDYSVKIDSYDIETDIKSKLVRLDSAPKGYNVDKFLKFLSSSKAIYLLYIVAMNGKKSPLTELASVFQKEILERTKIQKHWAGRNSRGVAQFDGNSLEYFVNNRDININVEEAKKFLERLLGGNE